MSYQVLARKWRPQNFKEMVGQQHVLRGLINALDNDRLHHAYLFTGTRGVGKTTVARILAKCLNCETGVTSEPCGSCGACQEIAAGRFVDLIEVDAASRTKVEDTRELLDNVQYAPTHGRFKVYLIDEVHMLSGHSFNALLKTLEEPPEHVKFLFATTDPQKLPVTILSRCLQFNLKRMTLDMISGHLKHLLQAESIPGDDESVRLLSRAADGSMRDALSLMDQAIAFGNGSLVLSEVQEMLGSIANDPLIALIKMVAAADGAGIIHKVEDMAGVTPDFAAATDALIAILHQLAVLQVVQGADEDDDNLRELSQQLTKEDVQLYYQIAINGRKDLSLAPDPRSGFEMLLLRMLAFRPTTIAPVVSNGIQPEAMADTKPAASEYVRNVEVDTEPSQSEALTKTAAISPVEEVSQDEIAGSESNTDLEKSNKPTELKKKTITSQAVSIATLEAPVPAPALSKSIDQNHIDEEGVPPVWDEYDQMLSQAVVSKVVLEQDAKTGGKNEIATADATSNKLENSGPSSAQKDSQAPPWDVVTPQPNVPEKEDKVSEVAPKAMESASITDLLFADFPEDIDEADSSEADVGISDQAEPGNVCLPLAESGALVSDNASDWYQTIESLEIAGLAAELAKNCVLDHETDEKIELHLDTSSEMLMSNAAINEIEAALTTYHGRERKLVVAVRELTVETPAQYNQRRIQEIQISAERHIENDSFVLSLSKRFSARVVPGSVKPKA